MKRSFKKTYKFAGFTSFYITLFLTVVMGVLFYYLDIFNVLFILVFSIVCYLFCFFFIQYRVEKFIYKRVKKIYDNVSLLEASTLQSQPITTDMATLTKEVERFARDKKLEIETLQIREDYRKEFIGNIAHELKTPLFTVQSYILTLLEGAINDKNVREKHLFRASRGVERLIYIVKDLDMITKLEVGDLNIHLEIFDIVEIVQNVFDLYEMKAAKNKITLTFDTKYKKPILVNADKDRIQQVLSNLIVNSIKYGKVGGTTEVSVENLIRNKIIVRVTDNGEGIDGEHLPRLFERFYRVDKSGSRKDGGSGLGLAIVKHIIEAHNEKMYIESDLGIGSEFSFTLEKSE